MAQSNRSPKYVYDLPYLERMELCRTLDQNDKWEELGGIYMHFDVFTIQTLRREILRGNSPTDELLTKWGHQNHTILELFVLLSKMQHYQAMMTIKHFVDPEFHRLIYEGEENLSRIFKLRCSTNSSKILPNQPQLHGTVMKSELGNCGKVRETVMEANNLQPNEIEIGKSDKITFNEGLEVKDERKILNNEAPPQLANKNNTLHGGENAAGNEASQLSKPNLLKGESTKDKNVSEISSIAESVGILPVITFKELETATNGWHQSTILGKGGFGTVYKGTWKNTQVAIKRTKNSNTDENHSAQIQQILGELKMLNSYRHDNILPLYGFSLGTDDPCLIYQYMPNGSLEDRLLCRHGTKPLTWLQRHNIATGTARGLQFLHTIGEKPLIHGDIKSANILLDLNFEPKIGDFGLAREGPYNHYTHMKVSKVHGTRPYLPDEFLRHKKFSTKVDTHSFGIVLFELATGLRAYDDQRSHKFLKDLIENSDEQALILLADKKCGLDEHQTFPNLITLGKFCTSRKPKDRPEMVMVLQELNTMAVRRDSIFRAQNASKQNNFTPAIFHDIIPEQLIMQKKIPPSTSSVAYRAVSPIPPFGIAQTSRANPVDVHMLINQKIPFPNFDHTKGNGEILKERSVSPNTHINAGPDKKHLSMVPEHSQLQGVNVDKKAPLISVVPPSDSQSSTELSTSNEENLSHTDNHEDIEYQNTSQFDYVLPLISELGIKTKSTKRTESPSRHDERISDVNTSAKGKKLWILDQTG